MEVFLATPERRVFSGQATEILVNAEKGQLNILERHANLITLVKPGLLKIVGPETKSFTVGEGVLKIENNRAAILCAEMTEG